MDKIRKRNAIIAYSRKRNKAFKDKLLKLGKCYTVLKIIDNKIYGKSIYDLLDPSYYLGYGNSMSLKSAINICNQSKGDFIVKLTRKYPNLTFYNRDLSGVHIKLNN